MHVNTRHGQRGDIYNMDEGKEGRLFRIYVANSDNVGNKLP